MKKIDMERRTMIVVLLLVACVWQIQGNALGERDNKLDEEPDDQYYKDGLARRDTSIVDPSPVEQIVKRQAQNERDNHLDEETGDIYHKGGIARRDTNMVDSSPIEQIVKRLALGDKKSDPPPFGHPEMDLIGQTIRKRRDDRKEKRREKRESKRNQK